MLRSKGFHRGINLGGWLSQCDYSEDRLNYFITESDIEKIASWGLDHVRIPIDYNVLENDDGSYKAEGFERIEKALGWCRKNGLKAILDLHKTAGFSFDHHYGERGFFDSEALQERFCRLWEEIARHFGSLSDEVAFELLNEVTAKEYIDIWNALSVACVKRIRAYAPDTLILIGSYYNNSAEAVKDLAPPCDDKIVYNFHCYAPLKFTHQGATWTDQINPEERMAFEDSASTEEYFENLFAEAIETAKKNNTVLYCGEYGVIDHATPEDTVKWFKVINAVLERHGIARAAWSYKEMDFGISDSRLDGVREELVRYL